MGTFAVRYSTNRVAVPESIAGNCMVRWFMRSDTAGSRRSMRVVAIRDFRMLWLANAFGDIGANIATVALSVTAVVVLDATSAQVAVIAALSRSAYLVVALPVGVWVDRWDHRRVLIFSDLARVVSTASIPVAYLCGVLTIWQMMAVAAITSVANVFFDIAHTAIVPTLVGRDAVAEASARLQSADTVAGATVPALAGNLIAATPFAFPFVIIAAFNSLSTLFVSRIADVRKRVNRPAKHEPLLPAMRTGLRYVAGHRLLRVTVLAGAMVNFGAGMYNGSIALFVLRDRGLTTVEYGYALTLGWLGGVVGSLVALTIRRRLGEIRAQIVGYFGLTFAFAAPAVTASAPVPAWIAYGASVFLLGFLLVVISVSTTGINARLTPRGLLGRVSASRRFVTLGIVPVGALVGGVVSTHLSAGATLLIAAAFPAATLAVFAATPLIRFRNLPKQFEEPGEIALSARN